MKIGRAFERSVNSRALVEQIRQLQTTGAWATLEGPTTQDPSVAQALGASEATIARKLKFGGWTYGVADVVLLGDECAAVVRACAEAAGEFWLLAEELRRVARGDAQSQWVLQPGLCAVRLRDTLVRLPHCWTEEAPGRFLVLHS